MKLVSTIRKSKNSWLYVLTDAGRWRLNECFESLESQGPAIKTRYCKYCGKAFTPTNRRRVYCGHCGSATTLSKKLNYEKIMADDEKHSKKIEAHRKWREWAKTYDPEYRKRKAEAQGRWRARQKAAR